MRRSADPMRAIWNDAILAESVDTVEVEGNHYFPPESVNREYVTGSDTTTDCPWKGRARYYDVEVAGRRIKDAAWYYPEPKPDAEHIRDHVAFGGGVNVVP
jgi:uncharacterized protein (DUF427 family)